tara:strand:+ start:91 stop:399 length:309 start_codon:yes stop_codon:yes gene_type:complete
MSVSAQKKTLNIMTSAECVENCCKERIEEEMQFTRGVTAVNLDIKTQILTVTFKEKKVNADKIREIISKIGYDADDVKADNKAHNKLPSCCQNNSILKRCKI